MAKRCLSRHVDTWQDKNVDNKRANVGILDLTTPATPLKEAHQVGFKLF
jgi:hypothetical protein